MVEQIGAQDFPQSLKHDQFVFDKFLAQGGEGAVCRYIRIADKVPVAVKFDSKGANKILGECLFYRNLCFKQVNKPFKSAPEYFLHDTFDGRRYLIIQYIQEDLVEYIRKKPKGKERDRLILEMGIQMLDKIKEMHEVTKYIHRDIKPDNFRVQNDTLYVTDFGLAQLFVKEGSE